MARRPYGLALLALLFVAAGPTRLYRNAALKVRSFQPPPGWEAAPQRMYPRLLAAYANAEGGRLTLAAAPVRPGVTAIALAEQAHAPLAHQGYQAVQVRPDGDRARVEARGADRLLEQLYVVAEGIGYVVTMTAPAGTSRLAEDFDEAARSLQVGSGAQRPPTAR